MGFDDNDNMSDFISFRDFCVIDDAFSRLKLFFIDSMHISHCLSRDFSSAKNLIKYAQRIRFETMQEVFNASIYYEFSIRLKEESHLAIPYTIYDDFSISTTSQDMSSSKLVHS